MAFLSIFFYFMIGILTWIIGCGLVHYVDENRFKINGPDLDDDLFLFWLMVWPLFFSIVCVATFCNLIHNIIKAFK